MTFSSKTPAQQGLWLPPKGNIPAKNALSDSMWTEWSPSCLTHPVLDTFVQVPGLWTWTILPKSLTLPLTASAGTANQVASPGKMLCACLCQTNWKCTVASTVSAVALLALLLGWLSSAAAFVGLKTCLTKEGRNLRSAQFATWMGSDVLPDVQITVCWLLLSPCS